MAHKQPTGFYVGKGRMRISVTMPRELFNAIRDQAAKDGKSFSDEAELLLKTGLFDIKESDRLEPKAA